MARPADPRLFVAMLGLAALIVVLDQATKIYVFEVLLIDRPEIAVLPVFSLVLRLNTGISFSALSHLPPWVFAGLAMVIAAGMLIWLARTDRRLPAIGLSLIIGGALGNLADRVRLGAVRDFLLISWPSADWLPDWPLPNLAFNVADVAISCGVVLLIWDGLFGPRKAPESP